MDLDFLPAKIKNALAYCELDNIYEIRLRAGFKIKVIYKDKFLYLTTSGVSQFPHNAILCDDKDIDFILKNVTEFSIYAHNERLKNGYLTANNGIRIGLAGQCVCENGEIQTVKFISSLNIRIPHFINGCANEIINKICDNNKVYNTLIISPPMQGKTTILKDIIKQLNESAVGNILVIDERGEFIDCRGENIDIISFSNKYFAFEFGVRSLSPKVIIADELIEISDWNCAYNASKNGVSVIASCHGYNLDDVIKKDFYRKDIFKRLVLLDSNVIGKINDIYYV